MKTSTFGLQMQTLLTRRYLARLVGTRAGQAHLLHLVADAEDSDEGQLFDRLAQRLEDETLQRVVRRHQADEKRHGALFTECLARTGITPPAIPKELKMLDRLDAALGGFLARPITSQRDIMETYLLLQVIEERAVTQFPNFEWAFGSTDPEIASVFAAVARDEERHLKYCNAIASLYAPDRETHLRTLERFRAIEARVYADATRANMSYALEHGYLAMSACETAAWRGLVQLGSHMGQGRPTPFWGQIPETASRNSVAALH